MAKAASAKKKGENDVAKKFEARILSAEEIGKTKALVKDTRQTYEFPKLTESEKDNLYDVRKLKPPVYGPGTPTETGTKNVVQHWGKHGFTEAYVKEAGKVQFAEGKEGLTRRLLIADDYKKQGRIDEAYALVASSYAAKSSEVFNRRNIGSKEYRNRGPVSKEETREDIKDLESIAMRVERYLKLTSDKKIQEDLSQIKENCKYDISRLKGELRP